MVFGIRMLEADPLSRVACKVGPPWIDLVPGTSSRHSEVSLMLP